MLWNVEKMAKKQTQSHYMGFSSWAVNDYIRECPNVVRWNPLLAVEWMNSISNRISSEWQGRAYNSAARAMNYYLDTLERTRYYDKRETWGPSNPQRVTILSDFEFDIDENVEEEMQ